MKIHWKIHQNQNKTRKSHPESGKMAQIRLALILCSYILSISGLPITSKPLDNNPDHLAWESWVLRGPSEGGKARKITPKSIFITPNLNNITAPICPQGYKVDHNGKCIQIVTINTADLLVTRLQSIFGMPSETTNTDDGGDVYDYGDYGESDDSGPYQVNLPLNIDLAEDLTPPQPLQGDNYYDSMDKEIMKKESDQKPEETGADVAFLAFDTLENDTLEADLGFVDTGKKESLTTTNTPVTTSVLPVSTTNLPVSTSVEPINTSVEPINTSVEPIATTFEANVTDFDPISTTTDVTDVVADQSETINSPSTTTEESENSDISTSTMAKISDEDTTQNDTNPMIESSGDGLSSIVSGLENNETTYDDDAKEIEKELEEESLMVESTSVMPTTEVSDFDMATFIEEEDLSSEKETSKAAPTTTEKIYTSTGQVHIVTPERPLLVTSTTMDDLIVVSESEVDKKNREDILRLEEKDTIRENIDSTNRFVYHHLPAIPTSSTLPPIIRTTNHEVSILEQLKAINNIVEENKRQQQQQQNSMKIRFPTRDDDLLPMSSQHNSVRFPGSATNRIVPDIFPKRSHQNTDSSTQRPFWWLPTGWDADQTAQKPMLLRFWSRMPLVRDTTENNRWRTPPTPNHRENSRSPSENFYKEVGQQDIYKVFNIRNSKQNR